MKKLTLLVLVLISTIVVSCIDYNETLSLANNGSGVLVFKVGLDQSLFDMGDSDTMEGFDENSIRKDFEGINGVKVIDSKSYSEDGSQWTEVTLKFESLEDLSKVKDNVDQGDFIGRLSMQKESDGNHHFTRTIALDDSEPNSDEFSSKMLKSMMGKYSWTYKTTFPGKVLSANTSDENIDKKNNTVTWTFSFGSLMQGPQVMEATIAPAGNSTIWILAFGIIILVGIVMFVIRRRPRQEV